MNKQTEEALKMAIEELNAITFSPNWDSIERTINACKEALEQPAQEPVAWRNPNDDDRRHAFMWHGKLRDKGKYTIPLYTHPAQPLSDDEIERLADAITIKWHIYDFDMVKFARAIEQAHHIGVKDEV
jgi:hypothetical protein